MIAEIIKNGFLSMQVCVPKEWDNMEVIRFTEKENPCGTSCGWVIREQGHSLLAGDDERAQCVEHEENCHIMLDA